MVDPVITLEKKTTRTKIDQKTILNHHIKMILSFQTHKKSINAVHQNIKDKIIKYNLQIKQTQTLQISTIRKLQNCS